MNTLLQRQFLSGIFLLASSLLTQSIAVATCPSTPLQNQAVIMLVSHGHTTVAGANG